MRPRYGRPTEPTPTLRHCVLFFAVAVLSTTMTMLFATRKRISSPNSRSISPHPAPRADAVERKRNWGSPRGVGAAIANREPPWPEVFIIGTPKAATTSLFATLLSHPQLCAPRGAIGNKEVHFFNQRGNFERGAHFYLSHFGHDPKCARRHASKKMKDSFATNFKYMDGTPTYLRSQGAAGRMYDTIPKSLHSKLRFIAVLREPVSRHLSWFNHQRAFIARNSLDAPQNLTDIPKFHKTEQHLNVREMSFHMQKGNASQKKKEQQHATVQLHRMVVSTEEGGPEQSPRSYLRICLYLMILNYETVIKNSSDTLERIARFLNLDPAPHWTASVVSQTKLVHKNRRSEELRLKLDLLPSDTCRALRNIFQPHNERLYDFLKLMNKAPEVEPAFPPFEDPCASYGNKRR